MCVCVCVCVCVCMGGSCLAFDSAPPLPLSPACASDLSSSHLIPNHCTSHRNFPFSIFSSSQSGPSFHPQWPLQLPHTHTIYASHSLYKSVHTRSPQHTTVYSHLHLKEQQPFTFTFMHLADTFIQSDLHCIQVTIYTFF